MTIFDTLVAELGDPLLTARRVPVEPRPKAQRRYPQPPCCQPRPVISVDPWGLAGSA